MIMVNLFADILYHLVAAVGWNLLAASDRGNGTGDNITQLFSSTLMLRTNKLECLSLPRVFNLVKYLWVKTGDNPIIQGTSLG
jgi:hypothetical protein